MKDLIVLVADKDAEQTLSALLSHRQEALGIESIRYDIFVHPERDGGVRSRCVEFLRTYIKEYRYALIVFDYEGCGASQTASELEIDLEQSLQVTGWRDRIAVIVIDPELENWVFSPSPQVAKVIADNNREIYDRHYNPKQGKPTRPKETMQQIMRKAKVQRSSALFYELARKVSWKGCTDPAFQKLIRVLRQWFGLSHPLQEP